MSADRTGRDAPPHGLHTSAPESPDAIERAPFFSDPLFQEFFRKDRAQKEEMERLYDVFNGGRYRITSLETLRGVLEDAFTLYDIVDGNEKLSALLAVMERCASEKVFGSILVDLHRFLAPRLAALARALPPDSERLQ